MTTWLFESGMIGQLQLAVLVHTVLFVPSHTPGVVILTRISFEKTCPHPPLTLTL